MRISDWSSDVCSSDLQCGDLLQELAEAVCGGVLPAQQRQLVRNQRMVDEMYFAHILSCSASEDGAVAEIGRASCRERVCQYVYISVVAVTLIKKYIQHNIAASICMKNR